MPPIRPADDPGPGANPLLDVLPPGHKSIHHDLLITGAPADLGGTLLAGPLRGFAATPVRVGEPFRFSAKYGTRLHLIDRDQPPPDNWPADGVRVLASGALPREVSSLPVTSPVDRILTVCELERDGARLHLRVVAERRFDSAGRELAAGSELWLLAPVAVGIAGLALLRRRRGRTGA